MTTSTSLWKKLDGASLDAEVQRFCAGDDVLADRALFAADVKATQAHVRGLVRIGTLTAPEGDALVQALDALALDFKSGAFVLDERYEDGHSAIEAFLVGRLGDVGKKVHTGRSRNDQVLVALRLVSKEQLFGLAGAALEIAARCLERGGNAASVPMPGHTHLQPAMPTTLGAFFAGHGESFLDAAEACLLAVPLVDRSPLGTASGFGVPLALDRDGVAQELGFAGVVVSGQAAQASRGSLDLVVLGAALQVALAVRRLAWDLSLFCMGELGFCRLPDAFTTGSSLMPNKKNPDVVELLRALPGTALGALVEVASTLSLPSGYHRDLQATKAPVLRATARVLQGAVLVPRLVDGVEFDEDRLEAAIGPEMLATDRAMALSLSGVPFRDAYRQAAEELDAPAEEGEHEQRVQDSIDKRVSLGGAGNLGLDRLHARAAALAARVPANR